MTRITPTQARAQLRQHHFAHMHPSITAERVADAVEPDAEQYECESCGEPAVYGAAEIPIAIA